MRERVGSVDELRLPGLIKDLYRIVGELEAMFPGRRFTPDGHMVGSLGECIVAHHYGVQLHAASHPGHDGVCNGQDIQIKATQGGSVALRSEPCRLIVIQLDREGGYREIYNGPGEPVWNLVKDKPAPSNGQRQVSLSALRRLMEQVPEGDRIPIRSRTVPAAQDMEAPQ